MTEWHRGRGDPGVLHIALSQTTRVTYTAGPRWVWTVCGVQADADPVRPDRGAQCLWCRRWAVRPS